MKNNTADIDKALQELTTKLDEQGFFEQYCRLVCPRAVNGKCTQENCPYGKEEIMGFWTKDKSTFS